MNRKGIKYLLLTIILVSVLTVSAFADVMGGVVTGSYVNVRASASISGKWLQTLPKGTQLVILGKTGNWYNISYNGLTGYMSADYVEPLVSSTGDFGYATVTGSFVNLRSKPTTASVAMRVLSQGMTVKVLGIENGWYKVEALGVTGYMSAQYLEPIGGVADNSGEAWLLAEGMRIVETAKKYLGIKYVWGGSTPTQGFDCSGLTQWVYNECGYTIRYRVQQYLDGVAVDYEDLMPGDLVFFSTNGNGGISHVGIYVGDGEFIHAPKVGKPVQITNMASGYYKNTFVCARRLITEPND